MAIALSQPTIATNRSILRPQVALPEITTYWQDAPQKKYTLKDSHIEQGPMFKTFDKTYFYEHLLPKGPIPYRRKSEQSVKGEELSMLIEGLLKEIVKGNKRFTHFEVLKDADFNYCKKCGAMILKFKNYPFVLKLFAETPENFVKPFAKGFEPSCFFIMGGGIMRHLTGFMRIKNMEDVSTLLQVDPYWSKVIDFPRKWFWVPRKTRMLVVEGRNMGTCLPYCTTEFPGLYAIVADQIEEVKSTAWFDFHNAERCMRLSQFTEYRIDPHLNNFMIEEGTGKMVIIDTENFRALVGLKERFIVDNYGSWYMKLTGKFIKDRFFRSKRDRMEAQLVSWEEYTA